MSDIECTVNKGHNAGEAVVGVARGCAQLRKPGDTFTLVVEMYGKRTDVDQLNNQLHGAAKHGAPKLIGGYLSQIDDDRLGGKITFEVPKTSRKKRK